MEINVLFLGILKYKDKTTKEDNYRFSYLINDESAKQNTENFKGLSEYAYYTNNANLFNTLTPNDILQPMKLIVENRPSQKNPLRQVSVIKQVKTKNAVIDLL